MNGVTIVDSYQLPNIKENIEKLAESQVFLTLDEASVYHRIPVEKQIRQYLAFGCAFGSYTIKRMAFGTPHGGAT